MKLLTAAAIAALAYAMPLAAEEAAPVAAAPAAGEWRTFATEAYRGKRDSVSFVDAEHGWYGTGAGDPAKGFLARLGFREGEMGEGVVRELTARRRDGETFPVDVALGAMELPTGTHLVAIVRDISERRRIEHLILEFGPRAVPLLTSIAQSPRFPVAARCVAASGLVDCAHSCAQPR